jgi:hypothetical protein
MEDYGWTWIIFVSFIVITSFILYSLIIAVVCDAVSESEHSQGEKQMAEEHEHIAQRLLALEATLNERLTFQQATLKAVETALEKLESDDDSQTSGFLTNPWLRTLLDRPPATPTRSSIGY